MSSQTGGQQAQSAFITLSSTQSDKPITYQCGLCASDVPLKRGDAIRCKECGYRVLYKKRTNRVIQFEAR